MIRRLAIVLCAEIARWPSQMWPSVHTSNTIARQFFMITYPLGQWLSKSNITVSNYCVTLLLHYMLSFFYKNHPLTMTFLCHNDRKLCCNALINQNLTMTWNLSPCFTDILTHCYFARLIFWSNDILLCRYFAALKICCAGILLHWYFAALIFSFFVLLVLWYCLVWCCCHVPGCIDTPCGGSSIFGASGCRGIIFW